MAASFSKIRIWALALAPAWLLAAVAMAQEPKVSIELHHDSDPPYTIIGIEFSILPSEAMDAFNDPAAIAELASKMPAMEDSTVTLRIPALLDYGMAGSYSNARISAGNGGVSLDPGELVNSHKEVWVGNVNITEFTHDVLIGSYDGDLYRPERINREPWMDAVPVGRVSGTFRRGMPDLDDDRIGNDMPASERARALASGMWDALRIAGVAFDDADSITQMMGSDGQGRRSGTGTGTGGGQGAAASQQGCMCECDVLISLPEDHHCVVPGGDCHVGLQLCEEYGLGGEAEVVDQPGSLEVEQLLDLMVGKDAPAVTRNAMREQIEVMSAEEREQLRLTLTDPDAAAAHALETREVGPVAPDAGQTMQYDAETLRYQALVEQLGMPDDITAEAVEMFFLNEAPMREHLWKTVREQVERKNQ